MCAKRVIKGVFISSNEGFSRNCRYFQGRCELRGPVRHGRRIVRGAILARRKRYKAHGICQTSVLLLNLLMIGLVM
jgi:hypothetical protein